MTIKQITMTVYVKSKMKSVTAFVLFVFLDLNYAAVAQGSLQSSAQSSYDDDVATIVVNFDPAHMKVYKYDTDDDYVVEEDHTNYHVSLDMERTLILKIMDAHQTLDQLPVKDYKVLSPNEFYLVGKSLVERVNSQATFLFLQKDGAYHLVDYTIYKDINEERMIYFAPPHISFFYEYDEEYYPGQPVLVDEQLSHTFNTRFYYHGETTVQGIENDVLLKMYNDACYMRPYGVTTPLSAKGANNPYKKLVSERTGERLFRSCQHPIQSEYLKGIGLYREFYQEDGRIFTSRLVSIDGIPIEDYLRMVRNNQMYSNRNDNGGFGEQELIFAMSSPTSKSSISVDNAGNPIAGNTAKGGSATPSQSNSPKTTSKTHEVKKGDTLYNISKRYDTTVEDLQQLNRLSDSHIQIGQELIIGK